MDDLIPLVNKLQDVFNTIGNDQIDLPQIVVVGSQSSGKSSVLENLVAKDFLPRGAGIVTRRPLVLQLVNVSDEMEEYGEFLHLPGRKFTDFNEIRDEIEAETARVAGANKGISRNPINLKVYSPHVVNLTLVDLPGLTKVPVGDQPGDIEKQIKSLIVHYISKPNSVILAVSPANVDIANSESLKLSKEVDPEGRRTIGVLTKVDLMDAGTNALDILTGRVYHLRLGFIGVVNRSQQDILSSKPIVQSLRTEREFFEGHPAYRNVANRCGTTYLARQLNHILLGHIREKLPEIKGRLNSLISQTQHELLSFGEPPMGGKEHRGTTVLQLLTRFATDYNAAVDGTSQNITTRELCGGARIYYIFNSIFGSALDAIDPCADLSSQDIRTAIRNSTGPRPSLFVPEMAFDLLVKPQILRLEPPSLRCVELAYEELIKICNGVGSKELQRYPKLYAKVIEVVSGLLRERLEPTTGYIQSLISIQRAYINTNHPDFVNQVHTPASHGGGGSSSAQGLGGASSSIGPGGTVGVRRRDVSGSHRNRRSVGSTSTKAGAKGRHGVGSEGEGMGEEGGAEAEGEEEGLDGGAPAAKSILAITAPAGIAAINGSTRTGAGGRNEGASGDANFMDYFFGSGKSERFSTTAPLNGPSTSASTTTSRSEPAQTPQMSMSMSMSPSYSHSGPLGSINSASQLMSEKDEMETQLIRSLIATYFTIVRKNIQDLVPKVVMHLLVDSVKENLQTRLVAALYKESVFDELLLEDEGITAERQRCQTLLDVYNRAFQIISEAV